MIGIFTEEYMKILLAFNKLLPSSLTDGMESQKNLEHTLMIRNSGATWILEPR